MRSVCGQHSSYHNNVFLAPRESPVLSLNDEDDNIDYVEYQTDSEVEDPDYKTNPRQWSAHNWIRIDEDDRERNVLFMQDGAPPHYLTDVQDFLNDRFPGQWIGRDAPR
ncbi:hypothetical protein J6590_048458 [Homalodisca vitripennis]|nr:hypothetical protein J6590_048458 [Homalodisca vitripennis]